MNDKYCPLRFREYDSNPHDQRCIGDYCAWFGKCSESELEPIWATVQGETDVRTETATEEPQEPRDTTENGCSQDSREKLEADILEAGCDGEIDYDSIIGWLDRQAAITERDYGERMASAAMCSNVCAVVAEQRERIAELQAKVDELTAETIEYDKALDAVKNDRDAWRERFEKANREKCDLQSSGVAQKFNNLCNRLRDKGITINWDDSRSDYWVQLPHDIETISADRGRWKAHYERRNEEANEYAAKLEELETSRDYWKRQYELICRSVEDVARNYTAVDDERNVIT